jgi:type IV pilus assembly protein PilC
MTLMISAHIPLITALDLVSKMIGFYPYERALKKMGEDVMNGKLLYESMSGQNLFDMKLISLTRVGEEVNKLSDIYAKLNRQYADELQHEVVVLNSMLEPVLIILIGLMVAIILVSMYLPMFQMGNSILG